MRTILFGALFTLAATGASAQEIMAFDDHFVAQKTRAQVVAELSNAQAVGVWNTRGEITWIPPVQRDSALDRADVRAEGVQAARMHSAFSLYDRRYQN